MGKLLAIFLFTAMLGALANGRVITMPGASSVTVQMPQNPNLGADREPNTTFYVHQIEAGPNKTVWNVAFADNTVTSPSSFGLIQMVDNIMTTRPELDSPSPGRVQGTLSFADLRQTAYSVNLNVIIPFRPFPSTLSFQGRLPAPSVSTSPQPAILSIIGGTGPSFRNARGNATVTYVSFDPSTVHTVFRYDVYLL